MAKPLENKTEDFIYSQPTMCLHCHLVVEMFHDPGADLRKGAWECPKCSHKYPFAFWKIKRKKSRKAAADKPEAA